MSEIVDDADGNLIGLTTPDRPAVILATADSIFTSLLAESWLKLGQSVKVVTLGPVGSRLSPDVEIVDVNLHPKKLRDRFWTVVRPVGHAVQSLAVKRNRSRFLARTGRALANDWEWAVWYWIENAHRVARVAKSLNPRFVFGQEVAAYGWATALCRPAPTLLFPWGSDIFNTPETWFGANWLVQHALDHVDLVVPSSTTAAIHLQNRFHLDAGRVVGHSWGIDPDLMQVASSDEKRRLKAKWGIPVDQPVVFNARRFRKHWGSDVIMEAFLKVANANKIGHFVVLGGGGADQETAFLRHAINQCSLTARFTIIPEELKFADYSEMASLADVYTSLVPRGDMRSSSVLHCAACGATPIIGRTDEYDHMVSQGFQADLIDCDSATQLADCINRVLTDACRREEIGVQNLAYLKKHENRDTQMRILLEMAARLCERE